VSRIYNVLLNSGNEQWKKTLFLIVYDEHGGFYDHVSPGAWTPADDRRRFQRYGVRVPALVISPWVGRQTSYGSRSHNLQPQEVIFDHTSILKTILRRFCEKPDGTLPRMSARVHAANDVSPLLTETQPRTDCTPAPVLAYHIPLIDRIAAADDNGDIPEQETPSELQESLQALAEDAMEKGVPPNRL
jgi:phospholipase C